MSFYYKFTSSGLDTVVKSRVYPLHSTVGRNQEPGNSEMVTNKIRMPLVSAFYITPLMLQTIDGERITIPEAVVSLTKSKEIKKTTVVAGNGTVKEYISDKDISLNIVVGIVATDDEGNIIDAYPEKGVKDLQKILDKKESIMMFSSFLSLFEIDGGFLKVVIDEYTVIQETAYNRQVFTIKATSDYDYTIYAEED